MRLKLFELVSNETWWVSSIDEHGVLSIIRDEMESRGFNDVEIDFMLTDFEVNTLSKYEAESIGVQPIHGGEVRSLWQCFISDRKEGVVGTSLDSDQVDMDSVQELNFDLDE